MDPEASKPDEFEAKIKILTDIVMSLARSSSEHDEYLAKHDEHMAKLDAQSAKHDERLARIEEQIARTEEQIERTEEQISRIEEQISTLLGVMDGLVQVSTNHQQTISRLLDITTALAENAVRHDRQLAEQRENLDVLTRTVDDWIRRNPRNGSAT